MSARSFWDLHEAACARGAQTYTDPETGFMVFTRLGLLKRERCCGAGCRHCPFGHDKVAMDARTRRIQQAAWLNETRPQTRPQTGQAVSLLFWSGGKDSFLALRAMQRSGVSNIVLLTTFDARSRIIAHQEFVIDYVVEQAAHLGVPVIGVPLHPGADYLDHIRPALELVPQCTHLCFGDLHLEHIRDWRVEAFSADHHMAQLELSFPLWKADYATLLDDLEASGAQCTISSIATDLPGIAVGDSFDRTLIEQLPDGVDRFGENGEFHTLISFD